MSSSKSPGRNDRVQVAMTGDLLLTTDPTGTIPPRDLKTAFEEVKGVFQECDIVLGNLECTLPGKGYLIPTEPRVIGTAEMVRQVIEAGFNGFVLANNHTFDCGNEGFLRLTSQLEAAGVSYCGAGATAARAREPVVWTVKGIRIALIGAVDRQTGIHGFTETEEAGVSLLDIERISEQVSALRRKVDHVIVSLHWGDERIRVPSPRQVEQARRLASAGASLIAGHHPHVLQGMEMYEGTPIIYSLGNFLASEVYFSDGDVIRWNRTERTGCILVVELNREEVTRVEPIPTYDTGRQIEVDSEQADKKYIERVKRAVTKGVSLRQYRREVLRVNTLRPIFNYLHWSRLKTLRWGHIKKAITSFYRSVRAK